jgi:uncharacterized protein YkwD
MLRKAVVAAAIALVVAAPAQAATLSPAERSLLQEINRVRAAHGAPPLRVDDRLQRAARAHSVDMMRRGYFSHGDFSGRLMRFGVRGTAMAENIGMGSGSYGTARGLVQMWLNSPGHRANMLNPTFRRIGVGVATGTFQGYGGSRVATTDFAS